MKRILFLLFGILLLASCEKKAATPITTGEDSTLDFRAVEKLLVCHNTGSETNPYELIEIAEPAYEIAHMDHGDALPGEAIPEMPGYKFGCNCEVEPEGTTCMPDGKTWTTANLTLEPEGYDEGEDFWWYDNDEATYAEYGRLYTWDAANKACQDLGDGWRLPTKDDWDALITQYDGDWPGDGSAFSTDAYTGLLGNDFNALLGGLRDRYGAFRYLGTGYYWSSTQYEPSLTLNYYVTYYFDSDYQEVSRGYNWEILGFSCRCVKD